MEEPRHGWETSKENIQPLSSGRRMYDLVDALPSSSAQGFEDHVKYEEYHLREAVKLHDLAKRMNSSDDQDPLQYWVVLTKYLPQHFPTMSKNVKEKHNLFLKEALQTFFKNSRYTNDPRLCAIHLEYMSTLGADDQIKRLDFTIKNGVGSLVADTYIRLAQLYVSKEDFKKAAQVLKVGIDNGAVPKDRLEEMKTHVEYEWGKKNAPMMFNGEGNGPERVRTFAAAVPIHGEKNEAVPIRQNLPKAAPTSQGRPVAIPGMSGNILTTSKKVALHHDPHGENDNPLRQEGMRKDMLVPDHEDRENNLEACRWNSKDTELENPAIPERQPKMKLFVDEETVSVWRSAHVSRNTSGKNERALRERKEDAPEQEEIIHADRDHVFAVPDPVKPKAPAVPEIQTESCVTANAFHFRLDVYKANMPDDDYRFDKPRVVPLPNSSVNRVMLRLQRYKAAKANFERKKKEEESELALLRKKVDELTEENDTLRADVAKFLASLKTVQTLEERLREQERTAAIKLDQKNEQISALEAKSESLTSQLTEVTTRSNMQDSSYQRLEKENKKLEEKIEQLETQLKEEREQHQRELRELKRKCEETTANEENSVKRVKKASLFITDGRSRVDETEIFEEASLPSSPSQNEEASRFQTYENPYLSVAENSFNPPAEVSCMNGNDSSAKPPMRSALAMVERPSEKDMMSTTPVAPMNINEVEIPPICFGGPSLKPPRKFNLYSSITDSFSTGQAAKPARVWNNPIVEKRTDLVKNLQELPENKPPQVFPPVIVERRNDDDNFRRPALPSMDENAPPTTLRKPRRSMILGGHGRAFSRPQVTDNDSSDEETATIFPRQGDSDWNVSNLTMALTLGPKPVSTSTPEREKTMRDIQAAIACDLDQEGEDNHQSEPCQYVDNHRPSRFSILNDPNTNLSTIQETSCENRSRSTTGSSSSTNTMSTTRFGGSVSSRSSSVPRSASRSTNPSTSNGYYSDTNPMH